jgi:uncharacterized membrane protein
MALDNPARLEPRVIGSATAAIVRKISLNDLSDALRLGFEDFKAMPRHYPVCYLSGARDRPVQAVLGNSVLPLLFPLAAGFAPIAPFAGLGSTNPAGAASAARKPQLGCSNLALAVTAKKQRPVSVVEGIAASRIPATARACPTPLAPARVEGVQPRRS